MSGEAARLYVTAGAEIDAAVRGLATVDAAVHRTASLPDPTITPQVDATQATSALDRLKARISGSFGGAGGAGLIGGLVGGGMFALASQGLNMVTQAVEGLVSGMVGGAMEMERYTTQFGVLLGSTTAAKERMAELTEFAKTTPFELPEVVQASKTLEVFTKGVLSTGEGLRLVGDIASGTGLTFGETAMWIGRMYDALQSGRPMGESLMRLQEMGALSGEARARIEALSEAVKNGSVSQADAWSQAAGEFGRYSGMMVRQSETLEGKASNLSDAWNQFLTKLGTMALPALKVVVDALISVITTVSDVTNAIASSPLGAVIGTLFQGASGAVEFFVGWLNNVVTAWNFVGDVIGNVAGVIGDAVNSVVGVADAAEAETDAMVAEFGRRRAMIGEQREAEAREREAYAIQTVERVRALAEAEATAFRASQNAGMRNAVADAAKLAGLIPTAMGAALRENRSEWMDALKGLIDAEKTSMSKAVEVGYLLAALNGKAIAEGLASEDDTIRAQTEATVAVMVNRLAELQGPAYAAAYDFGSNYVHSVAAGAEQAYYETGLYRTGGTYKPVAPIVPTPDKSRAQGLNWILGLADGISTGGKAVDTALERQKRLTEEKLAAIKAVYDRFQAFLSTWPAMSAAGIAAAMDKTMSTLANVWKQLDPSSQFAAVKSAGDEIARRFETLKLPPIAARYTEAIDRLRGYILSLVNAANATTDLAKREALLAKAAGYSARIDELQQLIDKLKEAAGAATSLQDAQREVGDIQLELRRNAIQQQMAAAGLTDEQRDALQVQLDEVDAAIERNRLMAEQLDLTKKLTEAQKTLAQATGQAAASVVAPTTTATGAPPPTPGEPAAPQSSYAPAPPYPLAPTGGSNTYVTATVEVTGPTLDPYGDFATRLAAALIPGLQRELERQGITL